MHQAHQKDLFQDKNTVKQKKFISKIYLKIEIKFNVSTTKVIIYTGLAYTVTLGTASYFRQEEYKLKLNFLRNLSRFSGFIAQLYIPKFMRGPLYSTYAKVYQVKQEDMILPYNEYKNFNEFFTRKVKPREINIDKRTIVSPADSKILNISEVNGNSNLLVKDIKYNLGEFLTGNKDVVMEGALFESFKLKNPKSKIYQVIFYLNPGDYHRYHSPANILIKKRNHIVGYLAPVKELYIQKNPRVYEENERVALFGEWDFGQFTQVYVGATNVGSMDINFDELKTNRNFKVQYFQKVNIKSIFLPKGVEVGKFNLGSTVVIFFETQGEAQWLVKEGDYVRYGQDVCKV
ncbi:phosphatidylserine decarboxylase, putative [Ichthyophthirius multifiliis]|uniref:phosphatidylserine decarboxylase n=1 Tax=Ichthyophthirius multifiliis TaxID=5932 RepID=G0QTJ9_ICHMU|nr:phosphatidylserine decarboxylase, putative [Ichthyophthirius multifiliis]EGR31450.1 phosphatidylserine decarboxylase, putative [Ichthyophthirius multifiliis]|eukprot:XP_004034936.1 phosphatidylserine decarboxylase, putative [Ichthyophthirius multifiliis]